MRRTVRGRRRNPAGAPPPGDHEQDGESVLRPVRGRAYLQLRVPQPSTVVRTESGGAGRDEPPGLRRLRGRTRPADERDHDATPAAGTRPPTCATWSRTAVMRMPRFATRQRTGGTRPPRASSRARRRTGRRAPGSGERPSSTAAPRRPTAAPRRPTAAPRRPTAARERPNANAPATLAAPVPPGCPAGRPHRRLLPWCGHAAARGRGGAGAEDGPAAHDRLPTSTISRR